jgi:hypothetical protein
MASLRLGKQAEPGNQGDICYSSAGEAFLLSRLFSYSCMLLVIVDFCLELIKGL